MKHAAYFALGLAVAVTPALAFQSDSEIRRRVVQQSIASHPGPCACPYTMRNGRSCGSRSAYGRPGGPICYRREVTRDQVEEWRRAHR